MVIDVTDQKQLEAALMERFEDIKQLAHKTIDPIFEGREEVDRLTLIGCLVTAALAVGQDSTGGDEAAGKLFVNCVIDALSHMAEEGGKVMLAEALAGRRN